MSSTTTGHRQANFQIEEARSDLTYLNRFIDSPVPQSEPLSGMVADSAGGHAYPVDDFTRLRRFLVLGSGGGSYYASERKLTLENAQAVRRCIDSGGPAAVREIVAVSEERRAPRVGPALFALARAASHGDGETSALAFEALPWVARTGSHLHEVAGYADSMRGWGRGLRPAIAGWYAARPVADAVYQRSSTATAAAGRTATCCARYTPSNRRRPPTPTPWPVSSGSTGCPGRWCRRG